MQAAERVLLPVVLLLEPGHRRPLPAVPEHRLTLVQPLAVDAVPALERGEVEQLRPRQRRRREIAGRRTRPCVELDAVEHRGEQSEAAVVGPRLELGAQPPEPGRVEQLVAVRAEHPGVGPDVGQDEIVRSGRVGDSHRVDVVELARQAGHDLPGVVGRRMVGDVDPVAECGDVADHALRIDVLVVEEDDPDYAHARDPGRPHRLRGSANSLRAEMPASRSSPCLRARTKIATLR